MQIGRSICYQVYSSSEMNHPRWVTMHVGRLSTVELIGLEYYAYLSIRNYWPKALILLKYAMSLNARILI